MDFGKLLRTAKENGQVKKDVRVYSTKFTPPKKEEKKAKTLSANIQKFLARKEAEEKHKHMDAAKKRDELLALRAKDKKATRRVNVMLKRTKSANQSVIADAVDKDNTSVTLAGPSQPDEDDYGYVSQEASAFYNKMMEKYSKLPDDPKFPLAKKKASNNLNSTKDRVRAALEREKEEALLPHRRKRKQAIEETAPETQNEDEEAAPPPVFAKPKPPPPPAMNFTDLLKLAAVKQHEPIMIEVKPKEEEGPLLTKKQKKEIEKEQLRRSQKNLQQTNNSKPAAPVPHSDNKIKKVISDNNSLPQKPNGKIQVSSVHSQETKPKSSFQNSRPQPPPGNKLPGKPTKSEVVKRPPEIVKRPPEIYSSSSKSNATSRPVSKTMPPPAVPRPPQKPSSAKVEPQRKDLKLNNVKERPSQFQKPVQSKVLPPKDLKPKQCPPPDVRKRPPPQSQRPMMKRRIIDDDDDYDSEMDDFIDDGPEETDDYSKYIRDIFGYDKRSYGTLDEDDVDNMESTFAQQMKEDARSTKLGIMEDLEDIQREKEEKKQKAIMMKRRKL